MKVTTPDNCLVHDEVFQKSIIDYNIMLKIIEDDKAIIVQSGQELLAIKSANTPTWMWIWIDPDRSETERKELIDELAAYETESHFETIWGYEEIVNDFVAIISLKIGVQYKINPGMNVYYCPSILIDTFKYKLVKADTKHIDVVSRIYHESHEEMESANANDVALNLIRNGCVYLLIANNEYVSMANVKHISMGYARINAVYTPIKLRCNGYATDLIAQLSKNLLDDNLIPVLYTEIDNLASNKVYRKVGYINTGRIVNARLIKSNL